MVGYTFRDRNILGRAYVPSGSMMDGSYGRVSNLPVYISIGC